MALIYNGNDADNRYSAPSVFPYDQPYIISGFGGDDELVGAFLHINSIYGGDGNDIIRGGAFSNYLYGGNGNDLLNAWQSGATSNLYGGSGNDHLEGGDGGGTLDGGAGIDTMIGGNGADTYVVDRIEDVVVESYVPYYDNDPNPFDTVRASLGYSLGQNLENLTLTGSSDINGTGNSLNNSLTGNSGNNTLQGLGGNDTLDGSSGNDILVGGAGNDTYIVNGGDTITENAGQGTDTVRSSVSFTLGANLENLILTGTASINGTGNSGNNRITGNSGGNTLNGSSGSDTLTGGLGNDSFVFNTALGSSNIDRITDFNVVADTIRLENAVFTGLAAGTLSAAAFVKNTSGNAADASDRIIYETDTGKLYFDRDGTGAAAKVHFATIGTNLSFTNADFFVF